MAFISLLAASHLLLDGGLVSTLAIVCIVGAFILGFIIARVVRI